MIRHSISKTEPYAVDMKGDPIYIQVLLLLPEWEGLETQSHGVLMTDPKQGYRRRCVVLMLLGAHECNWVPL